MAFEARIDVLLVEKKLAPSRTHAQRIIAARQVSYRQGGVWIDAVKPSLKLPRETEFAVKKGDLDRYVSRGALKLAGAISTTGLNVTGMTALDVGQSTGGFTDCLLQRGAAKVVGVDVGRDQLAAQLREDPRVICLEGINARALPADLLLSHTAGRGYDLAVMDVSFISQQKILPSLVPLLKPDGVLISLVKPQFEVGKKGVGKGGLVRDRRLYRDVEVNIRACCQRLGLDVVDYFQSPLKGGDGNREFLIYARR